MENTNKISNVQLMARKYIEDNDLERILSDMLNNVVHERVKDPILYMIKYLAGLMSEEERKAKGLIIPEPLPKGCPISKFPFLKNDVLLQKYITKELFNSIKYFRSKQGGLINDILKVNETNDTEKIGIRLTDGDSAEIFKDLIYPIIHDYHKVEQDFIYDTQIGKKIQVTNSSFPLIENINENIKRIQFVISRNLKDTPYVNILTSDKRNTILNEVSSEIWKLISSKSIPVFKLIKYEKDTSETWDSILDFIGYDAEYSEKVKLRNNFPDGRGIFYLEDYSIIILINFDEQIRFYATYDNSKNEKKDVVDIAGMYNGLKKIEGLIGRTVVYDYSKKFGYLNSDIRMLGEGIEFSGKFIINKIENEDEYSDKTIQSLLKNLSFDYYLYNKEENEIKFSSCFKLFYQNDINFLEQIYNDISGIIHFYRRGNVQIDKENISEQTKQILFTKYQFPPSVEYFDQNIKNSYDSLYEEEKNNISMTGLNINDLIKYYISNPENPYGIFLEESSQLKAFNKLIKNYLKISQGFECDIFKKINSKNNIGQLKPNFASQIENINICLIRNIEGFPFANSYINENAKVENVIISALKNLNLRSHFGNYFSLDIENQKEQSEKIIKENSLNIYIPNKKISNRGVIQFEYENVYALVNDIDHIKFYLNCNRPGNKFNDNLFNILKVLNEFTKQLRFINDKKFNFVTACPKYLGTGLVINVRIRVKLYKDDIDKACNEINGKLVKDDKRFYEFGWKVISDKMEGRTVVIYNNVSIGKTDNEIFGDLIFFLNELLLKDNEGK